MANAKHPGSGDDHDDKPNATPPQDKARGPKPDVLVLNNRRGIVGGVHSQPAKEQPSGGGVQQHDVDQLFLMPGLNLVAADRWPLFKPGLADRIARSEVVEIANFSRVSEPECLRAIGETGEVKVLQKLLADEDRPRIAEALEKQIASAERGGPTIRRAHAAHARA